MKLSRVRENRVSLPISQIIKDKLVKLSKVTVFYEI